MVVALCFLCSCAIDNPKINIIKKKMVVDTRYLENLKPGQSIPLEKNEEAITDWQFGCKTDFDFKVVEKCELGSEFLTSVRINKVTIELDAPVTVWISKKASKKVIQHENAHVLICRRVYLEAESTARAGAASALKYDIQGSGQTFEDALKNGLAKANQDICQYYHMNLVEKINRVSEVFDSLGDKNPDKSEEQLVDMAFKSYGIIKE